MGSSIKDAISFKNFAPIAPSITLWSTDKVRLMIVFFVIFSFSSKTNTSSVVPTARIEPCGGLIIAFPSFLN